MHGVRMVQSYIFPTVHERSIESSNCAPAGRIGNKQAANFDEAKSTRVFIMSLPVQFGSLRTRELRELLQNEDRISHIIRCSEKVQGVHRAAEKKFISNQKLAKVGLSMKPQFRDAKLLLAMKYKELEKLRNIIQAKQEQLVEKSSVHYAHWCLLKKINHGEEECELLFQRFTERKTPLADFSDSFLNLRKLQHVRLILLKKLQEMTELKPTQSLREVHPDAQYYTAGFSDQTCLPVCSLTTAVVLPACCHPPLLLPFGAHVNTGGQCLQRLSICHDYTEPLRAGVYRRGPKWPARPVRLQPLKQQKRSHQQKPQ